MCIIGVTAIVFSTKLRFIPFDMHIALGALLYFGLGAAIRHSTGWTFEALATSSLSRFAIVGTIVLGWFACAHFMREPISMSDNFFGSYPFSIAQNVVTSFLGTLAFFLLATSLPRSDLLRWLGTHTVPILGFNYVVSAAVVHLLDHSNANVWWLSFVLQAVLLATLAWLLDRTGIIGDIANGRLASRRPVTAAPSRQRPI
jgi:fucose 4-O-acetylase-like acetyltransferase